MNGNANSFLPLDLWIECTMYKGESRVKGLLKNEIVLHIHVRNTSNISAVKYFLENHVNVIRSKNKHKDYKKSRLQIYEQCVQDTLHKKWSFPSRISQVNVTRSAVSFIFCSRHRLTGWWMEMKSIWSWKLIFLDITKRYIYFRRISQWIWISLRGWWCTCSKIIFILFWD